MNTRYIQWWDHHPMLQILIIVLGIALIVVLNLIEHIRKRKAKS